MKQEGHLIKNIHMGSIAEEVGIESGDILLSINNQHIKDALDYHFFTTEEYLELLIKKPNDEEWLIEIEKEEEEPLGLEFDNNLMDNYKSCTNNCIFCFIDQMPEGMRDTLYFKDDDSRLSFLQGNYITMTNMKDSDVKRIIRYRLSPINISIHSTNLEIRKKMLNNRFADNILKYIKMLYDAQIIMNGQIVLCKGINDGDILDQSINDLKEYIPYMQSISVVPVGLTKFRDKLVKLEPFSKEDAKKVLTIIHSWQNKLYDEFNTHFIHASDEFYLLADEKIPTADSYDGYLQIENGVGMTRSLIDEFEVHFSQLKPDKLLCKSISIVTGVLAYPIIKQLTERIIIKFPNIKIKVHKIVNYYFGERITVSGLLTGRDIINQLKGQIIGEKLLLPSNLLKYGENILLDDISIQDIENALQVKVAIVQSMGEDLLDIIVNS